MLPRPRPILCCLLLPLLLLPALVRAQGTFPVQSSVVLLNPSIYPERMADPGDMVVTLLLADLNRPSLTGRLVLSLTDASGRTLSAPNDLAVPPITLLRGLPTVLTGAQLFPYLTAAAGGPQRGGVAGVLAEGPLTVCAEFYLLDRPEVGSVANASCALADARLHAPPFALTPLGTVSPAPQDFLLFRWEQDPLPAPADYELTVWEVPADWTFGLDVLLDNQAPLRFPVTVRGGLKTYQWQRVTQDLTPGVTYVYRIRAVDPRGRMEFRNDGYSAPATFRYGEDGPPTPACYSPRDPELVAAGGSDYYELRWRGVPNGVYTASVYRMPDRDLLLGSLPLDGPADYGAPRPDGSRRLGFSLPTALPTATGAVYEIELCGQCKDQAPACVTIGLGTPDDGPGGDDGVTDPFGPVGPGDGAEATCVVLSNPLLSQDIAASGPDRLGLGFGPGAGNGHPDLSYRLIYGPERSDARDTVALPITRQSYLLEGLTGGTPYAVSLCVKCPTGTMWCSQAILTTGDYDCLTEVELGGGAREQSFAPDGLRIDWTDLAPGTDPAGWTVQLDQNAPVAVPPGETSHYFGGLTAGQTYRTTLCYTCGDGSRACTELNSTVPSCADAELALREGDITGTSIALNWDGDPAGTYRLEAGLTGQLTGVATPHRGTDTTLTELLPGTTYDVRVCRQCGDKTICDQLTLTTRMVNCVLGEPFDEAEGCGLEVPLDEITNREAIRQLAPGDSIWAGDYLVEIATVEGEYDFTGTATQEVRALGGAKLTFEFENIRVNDECRLISGHLLAVNPIRLALADVADVMAGLTDLLSDLDNLLANLSDNLGQLLNILNILGNFADVGDEFRDVMEQTVTALEAVPYLPDSYVNDVRNAANCLLAEAALNAAQDLATEVGVDVPEELGELTPEALDCRNRLEEAIQRAQDYIDQLFAADYAVIFKPNGDAATEYYGLDSQRYELIDEFYDQRTVADEVYRAPWISSNSAQPGGIRLRAFRRDGGNLGEVTYIGSDTRPLEPPFVLESNQQRANHPGLDARGRERRAIFAAHPNPEANPDSANIPPVILAGQANLVTYDPKPLPVQLILVNGAPAPPLGPAALEAELNAIFRPAVASWSVATPYASLQVDDVPDFADGVLGDIPVSMLERYTAQMRAIKSAARSAGYDDPNTYYLLVVAGMATPGRVGFMPSKQHYGFLNGGALSGNAALFTRTVAHELGHGAYHLQHPDRRFPGVEPGSTDNLMDQGAGTALYKYQWDNVHDPEANFTLFDEEEEGEYVTVNMVQFFAKDTTRHDGVPYLTFVSNRGVKVNLPYREIRQLVFATGGEAYQNVSGDSKTFIPIGSLVKFVLGDDVPYINCGDGKYYQRDWGTGNCQSGDTQYDNPQLEDPVRPIACRHAVKDGQDFAHYVVLSNQADLSYENTAPLSPYDIYLREFYDIVANGQGAIRSAENIQEIDQAEFTLSGELANPVFRELYTDPELATVFNYDYPVSFYASGLAYLIYGMEQEAETCASFANNTRGLFMRRSAAIITTGIVDMVNTSIDVADGIGTAKVSETERLIGYIYDSGYYGPDAPTKQELAAAIVNVSWRGGEIAEYNARIAAINGDEDRADAIIDDLFSDEKYLLPCEVDGLVFPDYAALEFFVDRLFRYGNFTEVFGWYFENLGFSNDTEWFFTKFLRKTSPDHYVDLLEFLESPIVGAVGDKFYYEEILEAVEDDLLSSNGTQLITYLLDVYEAVISAPGTNAYKTEYEAFKAVVNAVEVEEALNLNLGEYDISDLKIIPYNYTGILNRVNWTNLLCKSQISLYYWCDWDASIFPATQITSVSTTATGDMDIYQRNKYVLFYASAPEDMQTTLRPFEPFVLDRESSFADAKKLIGNAGSGYTVMPGFVMKFLEENATNRTVEDVVFTAIDVATIAFPITKVGTIARVLAYADKASSVLGIAATYAAGDESIPQEVKVALNITSAFLGLSTLSESAFKNLADDNKATAVRNIAGNLDKAYTTAAVADNSVAAQRFGTVLDHIIDSGTDWSDAAHSTQEWARVKGLMADVIYENADDMIGLAGVTAARVADALRLLNLTDDFANFRALFSVKNWDWGSHFPQGTQNYVAALDVGPSLELSGAFNTWPSQWADGFSAVMSRLAQNQPFVGYNPQNVGEIDGLIRSGNLEGAMDIAITHSDDFSDIPRRGRLWDLRRDVNSGVISYENTLLRRDALRAQLIDRVPFTVVGTEGFTTAVRDRVFDAVSTGDVGGAVDELLASANTLADYRTALKLKGRYVTLRQEEISNLWPADELGRETNKIMEAVLGALPNHNVLPGNLTNVELSYLLRRLKGGEIYETFVGVERLADNTQLNTLNGQYLNLRSQRLSNTISYTDYTIQRNVILRDLLNVLPVTATGNGGITGSVIDQLRNNIAQAGYSNYFSLAYASNTNHQMEKFLNQLEGRYESLVRDRAMGTVSWDDSQVILNQITWSMLQILNDTELLLQTPRQVDAWDLVRNITNDNVPLYAVDINLINRLADNLEADPNLRNFLEANGETGFNAWRHTTDAFPDCGL